MEKLPVGEPEKISAETKQLLFKKGTRATEDQEALKGWQDFCFGGHEINEVEVPRSFTSFLHDLNWKDQKD